MPPWYAPGDGSGGGSGGGKKLPALNGDYFLNWDFQKLQDGSTPIVGRVPASPWVSNGVHTDAILGGFSGGEGGGYVALGPGGNRLVYSADFFASGGATGGAGTAANPSKPPDNTSMTFETGFLLKSLTTINEGTLFSKAFNAASWGAPYNAFEINLYGGNNGFIEFGMVDNADLSSEIGLNTSSAGGRAALRVGYNWLALIVDQVAKTFTLTQNGAFIKRGNFTTGINLGAGPYMFGGNPLSTSDCANVNISHCAVITRAKTLAEVAADAAGFLTL